MARGVLTKTPLVAGRVNFPQGRYETPPKMIEANARILALVRAIPGVTGAEAIKLFDDCEGKVDLLLTDMVMPEGMTGRELAQKLRGRKPALKVVFTSGYSTDIMGGEASLRGEFKFLQKPYTPPMLAKTVRECLDF